MIPGAWVSNNGCGMTVWALFKYCGVGHVCPFFKSTYNYNDIHSQF